MSGMTPDRPPCRRWRPWSVRDPALRQAITDKLDDERYDVRQAAVQALATLVTTDPALRHAITAKLDDEDMTSGRPPCRRWRPWSLPIRPAPAITAKLDDELYAVGRPPCRRWLPWSVPIRPSAPASPRNSTMSVYDVRQAAVQALAPLVSTDPALRSRHHRQTRR